MTSAEILHEPMSAEEIQARRAEFEAMVQRRQAHYDSLSADQILEQRNKHNLVLRQHRDKLSPVEWMVLDGDSQFILAALNKNSADSLQVARHYLERLDQHMQRSRLYYEDTGK